MHFDNQYSRWVVSLNGILFVGVPKATLVILVSLVAGATLKVSTHALLTTTVDSLTDSD